MCRVLVWGRRGEQLGKICFTFQTKLGGIGKQPPLLHSSLGAKQRKHSSPKLPQPLGKGLEAVPLLQQGRGASGQSPCTKQPHLLPMAAASTSARARHWQIEHQGTGKPCSGCVGWDFCRGRQRQQHLGSEAWAPQPEPTFFLALAGFCWKSCSVLPSPECRLLLWEALPSGPELGQKSVDWMTQVHGPDLVCMFDIPALHP